jgi:hypothetical protein
MPKPRPCQGGSRCGLGVVGCGRDPLPRIGWPGESKPNILGRMAVEGDSPVGERRTGRLAADPSTAGHVESRGKLGGPPSKANYPWRPIAHSTVRER